jgi:hypothetical protein
MEILEFIVKVLIYVLCSWVAFCGSKIGFIETFKKLKNLNKPNNND